MSNYGTQQSSTQSSNHHHHDQQDTHSAAAEEDGLLTSRKHTTTTSSSYFSTHRLNEELSTKGTDLVLLSCYLITGLLDSSATAIWGCFVSMQTGNSIYMGLGIANPMPNQKYIKAAISLGAFCFGSFCFARFHRYFGQRHRWVLMASFVLQVAMIVGAAVFVGVTPDTKPGDGHDLHWHVVMPLMLVAFQSSGQAITSRAVEYGPLTSVVLTSIYCDLFADAKLFVGITQNVQRNRRAAAPVLLLAGAILGGFFSKNGQIGIAGCLWVAAGLKVLIVVAWFFWSKDEGGDEES